MWDEIDFDTVLAELEELTPELKTRDDVVKRVRHLTVKTGRTEQTRLTAKPNDWLPSDYFVKTTVPLKKVEQPIEPHYSEVVKKKMEDPDPEPIIIDKANRHWRKKGLTTQVLDGKHRAEAAKKKDRKSIPAWVGLEALKHFNDPDAKGSWWSDKNGAQK